MEITVWFALNMQSKLFTAEILLQRKRIRDVTHCFPKSYQYSLDHFENKKKKSLILSFDTVKIEWISGGIYIDMGSNQY